MKLWNESFKREFWFLIIGSIIFTASFMWKDLFSDFREKYFPKEFGMTGRVIFTIIITIILLMVVVQLKDILNLNATIAEGDMLNMNALVKNHEDRQREQKQEQEKKKKIRNDLLDY